MENVERFLKGLVKEGLSDLHFKVRRPLLQKINGVLKPIEAERLTANDTEDSAKKIPGPEGWIKFPQNSEADTIPNDLRLKMSLG